MAIARSKLTTQGQISVPADVRRRLGIGPGSVLEWEEEDGRMFVRRAVRFSSEEIHRELFRDRTTPKGRTPEEMKEGIRRRVRERYARG